MAMTFDDPPLNEVALGRTFLPRPDFLVPHFGAFWREISDEFPKVAHAAPIFAAGEAFNESEGFFLPRIWMLSADSTMLVQVQQNRFHFNWRQTDETKPYIRFPAVQTECVRLWEKFEAFVLRMTGQPLQPVSMELTYVNLIPIDSDSSPFEVSSKTLQDCAWSTHSRFLPQPKTMAVSYAFDLPNGNGVLNASTALAQKQDGTKILRLELTVQGKPREGILFEQWSDEAHNFLVEGFKDLTKPAMHAIWKLRGA